MMIFLLFFYDSNTDYPSHIFNLDRSSKDKKINKFGLSLKEMCCTYDIHIMNGRLFNDKVGNFTCFSNNGKSVVDYMICSTSLFESVKNFGMGEESQARFRKGYSTSDNIFTLMTLIQKYLSKQNGRFYCIFIDYEKAFDKVKHNELWKALERINVHGNFLRILKSIYSNTTACVKTNCGLTKAFKSTVGTRQGCIGSPKIFSIFNNDLIKYLKHKCERGIFVSISDLFALMFADDVPSFSDTVARLQNK